MAESDSGGWRGLAGAAAVVGAAPAAPTSSSGHARRTRKPPRGARGVPARAPAGGSPCGRALGGHRPRAGRGAVRMPDLNSPVVRECSGLFQDPPPPRSRPALRCVPVTIQEPQPRSACSPAGPGHCHVYSPGPCTFSRPPRPPSRGHDICLLPTGLFPLLTSHDYVAALEKSF